MSSSVSTNPEEIMANINEIQFQDTHSIASLSMPSNKTQTLIKLFPINNKKRYFIGVIDILQEWDFDKKMERFFKVQILHKDGKGVSAVEPEW